MENQKLLSSPLVWGNIEPTEQDAEGHFMAIGTTGSGKSIMLRLLMQSMLPKIGQGFGHRALIYDAKQDLIPILASYVDMKYIKSFHPYDERAVGWDISSDVVDSATALDLTFTLIPETSSDSNPFFRNAARHITWASINSLILSKVPWTFSDLLRIVREPKICKRILRKHQATAYVATLYMKDPKLTSDIFASIATAMMLYEPIGASYEQAKEKRSIRDCIDQECIAILGSSEISREPIQRINCVLSKIWADRVLAQPEYSSNTFWAFFDELSEAGPLKHLASFAKKARSKNGKLCIAFQSIEGLKNPSIFGEHVTMDILANFPNRFVGRLECASTANFISTSIGEQDIEQTSQTISRGKGSSSTTYSNVTRKTVLPSELMSIDHCGKTSGLSGLFKLRTTDSYWDHIPPDALFDSMLIPASKDVPAFIPRSPESQFLMPWGSEQFARFEIPSLNEPSRKRQKNQDLRKRPENTSELDPDIF